jgi:hypothetical protein
MGLIAVAAWVCMTLAPIAIGFGSWALVKRVRHGWIAHILFVPALLGLEWLLVHLMFWGARDDGDGPPGLGLAMIPAGAILLITVAVYYAALGVLGATVMLKKMKSVRGISVH